MLNFTLLQILNRTDPQLLLILLPTKSTLSLALPNSYPTFLALIRNRVGQLDPLSRRRCPLVDSDLLLPDLSALSLDPLPGGARLDSFFLDDGAVLLELVKAHRTVQRDRLLLSRGVRV